MSVVEILVIIVGTLAFGAGVLLGIVWELKNINETLKQFRKVG